jgi:hypothetical protein
MRAFTPAFALCWCLGITSTLRARTTDCESRISFPTNGTTVTSSNAAVHAFSTCASVGRFGCSHAFGASDSAELGSIVSCMQCASSWMERSWTLGTPRESSPCTIVPHYLATSTRAGTYSQHTPPPGGPRRACSASRRGSSWTRTVVRMHRTTCSISYAVQHEAAPRTVCCPYQQHPACSIQHAAACIRSSTNKFTHRNVPRSATCKPGLLGIFR